MLSMVLRVGVILPVVGVGAVLTIVVLVQEVLGQVGVAHRHLHRVIVFFGHDFQHFRVVDRLSWRRAPSKGPVL